jgi:hypothetical protein
MEMLIEKGAYVSKTDRLLQKGIPTLETFDHLRRKNADNEMRAINKVGSSHTHTYDTPTRATIILLCVGVYETQMRAGTRVRRLRGWVS